jgi:hypothetical protein
MSERLALLSTSNAHETVEQFAGKVRELWDNLGEMTSKLDRRVQETLKPILRSNHPLTVIGLGVVGLGGLTFILAGSAVRLVLRKKRKEASFLEKGRRLGRAVVRVVENPDRVAQPTQRLGRDVLGVACTVAAATLAKKLIDRAF